MKQDVFLERLGVTVTVDSSTAKSGGEAMVAFVRVGALDLAVKLFHAPSESEPVRMDRFAAWIARPGRYPDPDGYLPWAPPQGKACDAATGRVLGCWMYAVDVLGDLESFVDLSSPNLWDYPRIAAFAGDAAAALAELEAHPLKPKPCDLSLSNLLVDRLGRPVFVDLDSFQVTVVRGGRATPLLSPAHLPAYLPRELQGLDLRVVERTAAHHRFAAAVLIYQLLMGLWHPYATVPAGDVEDRIAQGAFSFAPASGFAPPPGAVPGWDRLGPRMRDLFFRAFVDGAIDPDARPSLEEFRDELAGEAARARSGPQAPAAQARRSRPPRGAIRCKAAGAALAFPRWRSAFKRIAMRPPHIAIPRVSPRAAAAAVVVGLVVFVGLALALRLAAPLAAPPVRVVDPKEIAKIRAATSRRDAPTAPATTTPADPPERAGKAPPEIERLRPPRPFPEAFSTTDPRSHR